jgi:hypothetical protein
MKSDNSKTQHSRLKRLLIIFLMGIPTIAVAQDTAPTTLLPDIDPQDIEIRGEFVVRFPGIMRQPILGFNPRPRVFQIDPNRMPFIETVDQVVASLPISDLERPTAPEVIPYLRPERFNIWSTTGIGNFLAPESDTYLGLRLGERTRISGRVNHLSSGNYIENTDQRTSFRNLDGRLNLVHYVGDRSRLDFGVNGRSDFNYQAEMNDPLVIPPFDIMPRNNIGSYGTTIGYRNNQNALSFWDIGLNATRFDANLSSGSSAEGTLFQYDAAETQIGAALQKNWTASQPGNVFAITSAINYANYSTTNISDNTWFIGNLGATFKTRVRYNLKTSIGGRFYYSTDATNDEAIHFYPELGAQYDFNDRLTVKSDISGFVHNQGFEGHSRVNRRIFQYNSPETESGFKVNVKAEYSIFEGFKAQTGLSYTRFNRLAVYTVIPFTEYLSYSYLDNANVLKWDGSVWFDLIPNKFHLYGGLYAQFHSDDEGEKLPFYENFGASAGGTYKFTERTNFHAWADFTGSRATRANLPNANGYLLAGAKVDIWLSRDIGAYLKVTNLFNQSYSQWVGYDELPTQIYGGIMIKL